MNFHLKDGLTEDFIYRQANARGSTDVISIFLTLPVSQLHGLCTVIDAIKYLTSTDNSIVLLWLPFWTTRYVSYTDCYWYSRANY